MGVNGAHHIDQRLGRGGAQVPDVGIFRLGRFRVALVLFEDPALQVLQSGLGAPVFRAAELEGAQSVQQEAQVGIPAALEVPFLVPEEGGLAGRPAVEPPGEQSQPQRQHRDLHREEQHDGEGVELIHGPSPCAGELSRADGLP